MSKITLSSNASGTGTLTIASPNTSTDRTLTLPDETGTVLTSASPVISQKGVPAFSVTKAANQAIGLTTYSTCAFDTVGFDTHSAWNVGSSRYTPPIAGYYQFNLALTLASSNTGETISTIYRNGLEVGWASSGYGTTNSGRATPTVSIVLYMNGTTDYVEGKGYILSGTSPIITGGTRSIFSGILVAAA